MEHELKTWPEFFEKTLSGKKKFEIRKNDRNFKVGDTLILKEYKTDIVHGYPTKGKYTGRSLRLTVDYILEGYNWGLRIDFIIMSVTTMELTI